MKASPIVFLYNILSASVAAGLDLKTVVGDGCKNEFKYSYAFYTDDGVSCDSCKLCTGTRIGFLFDQNHKSFCIECGKAEGQCTTFQVATTFQSPWTMKFFSLISSDMVTDNTDPSSVELAGSIDGKTWATLLSTDDTSGSLFKKRTVEQNYILNNNNDYSYYTMTYKLKKKSSTMHLGTNYMLQVYMKECAAKIYSDASGLDILPYSVTIPTNHPPITNLALKGTATQSTTEGYGASLAIDGNTNGVYPAVTHTLVQNDPWWKVNLNGVAMIVKIVVWNRTDCCSDRLSNSEVKIQNGSTVVAKKSIGNAKDETKFEFNFDGVLGNIVEVKGSKDVLSLAEVQVYGYYKNG